MAFTPAVGERLRFGAWEYEVLAHPNAPRMPFVAEGGRAQVFRLKAHRDGTFHALKVFKLRFRSIQQSKVAHGLAAYASLKGMAAANRIVIEPGDPIVARVPDLAYAVVMPWVQASTWHDILMRASGKESFRFASRTAVKLAADFLTMLESLEERGVAHCDISAGNVMVDLKTGGLYLLDLEDAFFPGAQAPAVPAVGTPGYRHEPTARNGGCWSLYSDRHASAILAAEMLLLASPTLAGDFGDSGLFAPSPQHPTARARIAELQVIGRAIAPRLCAWIDEAIRAPDLKACPSIGQLAGSARLDLAALPGEEKVIWISLDRRQAKGRDRTPVSGGMSALPPLQPQDERKQVLEAIAGSVVCCLVIAVLLFIAMMLGR